MSITGSSSEMAERATVVPAPGRPLGVPAVNHLDSSESDTWAEGETTGDEGEGPEKNNPTQSCTNKRKRKQNPAPKRASKRTLPSDCLGHVHANYALDKVGIQAAEHILSAHKITGLESSPRIQHAKQAARARLAESVEDENGWTELLVEPVTTANGSDLKQPVPYCTIGKLASLQQYFQKLSISNTACLKEKDERIGSLDLQLSAANEKTRLDKEGLEALHTAELEKKDSDIQKMQELLDQARRERDELRQAQSTQERPNARVCGSAGNQDATINGDTPSGSTGQIEARTDSPANNDSSTGGPGQSGRDGIPTNGTPSSTPASQLNDRQGKRQADAALPYDNGERARQGADSAGSIVFNVEDFMTGTLHLPIPQPIAEKLRGQIVKWRSSSTVWNDYKSTQNPICIDSRIKKRGCQWSHGMDKACNLCSRTGKLCVTWVSRKRLCLMPVDGGAEDQQNESHWRKVA